VNLIDTADTYGGTFGSSETVLGAVLRDRRDDVLLATKIGYGDLGPNVLTYDNVVAGCEGRNLGWTNGGQTPSGSGQGPFRISPHTAPDLRFPTVGLTGFEPATP
jgi:hypothetical protein